MEIEWPDPVYEALPDGQRLIVLDVLAKVAALWMRRSYDFRVSGCMCWPDGFERESSCSISWEPK